MSHTFNFTVEVDRQEDPLDIKNYFRNLEKIFADIANLACWGFNTPVTSSQVYLDQHKRDEL